MFNILKKLNTILLPKSLPFRERKGGNFDKYNNALLKSEARLMEDALSVLDSTIPDNPNFTMDDALAWEKRLGIVSRDGVSLDDRIKAIILKMNYPIDDAPRQHYLYIEEQLRNAGFDVRVYENRFEDSALSPIYLYSVLHSEFHGECEHSDDTEHLDYHVDGFFHGEVEHSDDTFHFDYDIILANHIEEVGDLSFLFAGNYRSTFFIAGATLFTRADIQKERKEEFRQLLLQLKPQQTVGFLFVNYI